VVGTLLALLEGLVYLGMTFAVGLQQWGADPSSTSQPSLDRLYRAETVHWTTGLIVAALVLAALAAWRRALWTAGLQVLAALVFLALLAQTNHHYDVTHPKPVLPYTGPVCYSGSNNCN
jgi:hypothetical protein